MMVRGVLLLLLLGTGYAFAYLVNPVMQSLRLSLQLIGPFPKANGFLSQSAKLLYLVFV